MKAECLDKLFSTVYLQDIVNRHRLRDGSVMESVLDFLASSVGSLINPDRLVNMFNSVRHVKISSNTVREYIEWLCDAFIVERSMRYDVKGGGYIGTPYEYYFTDTGLRNSRVGFRQLEETHIMENVIYNELGSRGYKVDVGDVVVNEVRGGKNVRRVSRRISCATSDPTASMSNLPCRCRTRRRRSRKADRCSA